VQDPFTLVLGREYPIGLEFPARYRIVVLHDLDRQLPSTAGLLGDAQNCRPIRVRDRRAVVPTSPDSPGVTTSNSPCTVGSLPSTRSCTLPRVPVFGLMRMMRVTRGFRSRALRRLRSDGDL
jgi:hypothetical protein